MIRPSFQNASLARVALLVIACLAAPASAESPEISEVLPGAAAPGRTVEVTVRGRGLSKSARLWTSFPAEVAPAGESEGKIRFKLTLPPDAQVGVGAVRLVTEGGVSGLRPFMVDDLPSVAEAGGNSVASGAQALDFPVAVDGTCDARGFDYYRFVARKGQRVSVEVVAARLGSQLDPVVRLLDAAGHELAWCDDAPGAGSDCRLAHTFAADGTCLIELRDANYEGGPAYRYRLRVGDFPLPTVPFPLGAKRGSTAKFDFLGPDCAGVRPVTLRLPDDATRVALSAAYEKPHEKPGGSDFVTAVAGDVDETAEAEPNDSRETATPLAVPCAVSGKLETAGDRDFFKLHAAKGQRILFRARSRSLGSPCDVLLQLYKPDGSKLAASKVEATTDGSLDATIPADGDYALCVEDLNRAGGPGLAYRVEVEQYRPGFALSVDVDKVEAKAGGSFEVKVTCTRRDYAGPVTLSVTGLPPGVTLDGATIGQGKNDTVLKVKLPPAAAAPAGGAPLAHFRIIGTARVGDADVSATASTLPALRRLFPTLLYPPEQFDGLIALGLTAP
jgi:hypothetical protein